MITRWWWVRHGPTHSRAANGWTDIPADLSDVAALERLRRYLPAPALVISSDLVRARDTAEAVLGPRELGPAEKALREMHFGDWEGRDFTSIAETEPELSRRFWEEPGDAAPPNGESWNRFGRRVRKATADITDLHRGRDIVAVAHFGTILAALQSAAGMDARTAMTFRVDNLSVTRLDFLHETARWRVGGVNLRP